MRKILKVTGIIAGAFALLVLLSVGWLVYDARHTRNSGADYVALGSSFAAGPGVIERSGDAPILCGQSADNYAHLLARKRGLRLLDRSCGGSTTADILTRHQFFQTPQVEAVQPSTRLVTITTGGNDLGYLGGMWGASCRQQPGALPWWLKSACKARFGQPVDAKLRDLTVSMGGVADAVRRRAPHATIAFIDYTTVLPEGAGCPRLPLSAGELAQARRLATGLSRVTAQVAHDKGALLIRASELTRGHDVCSADPWVFGWEFPHTFMGFGPYAYHPTAKAMAAIAHALDARLPRPLTGAAAGRIKRRAGCL